MRIRLTDLPAPIRTALESNGYHRADVDVTESATYQPAEASAGFTGNRGFCVAVNVATGERHTETGAWGGANPFEANAADHDRANYPIPPNCAVVMGETGGAGSFARVYVAPGMLAGVLPAAAQDSELAEGSALALVVIASLKSGARAESFARSGLGPYSATNPNVAILVERKLVTVNKAGAIAITTEGKNAREALPAAIRFRVL